MDETPVLDEAILQQLDMLLEKDETTIQKLDGLTEALVGKSDELVQQMTRLTDYVQNYSVLISVFLGIITGLLCVTMIRKRD